MDAIQQQQPATAAEVTPTRFDLMALARRRAGMMLTGMAVAWALTLAYYVCCPRQYESTAQILVVKKDGRLPARGVEMTNEAEPRLSDDILATHMQLLQSPEIVRRALEQHGYDKLPSIVNHLKADQEPAEYVIARLNVTRGGLGQARAAHVLNVSFRHSSADEAAAILQAIVDSYQKFLGDAFQDVSAEAVKLITRARDDISRDLDRAERTYEEFREQAPIMFKGDESANAHRANFEQIQKSLSEVKVAIAEAATRMKVVEQGIRDVKARQGDEVDLLSLLDEKHMQRLELLLQLDGGRADSAHFQSRMPTVNESARAEYGTLLEMTLREKALLAELGPEHPQVTDLRQQIAVTRDYLRQEPKPSTAPRFSPSQLVHSYVDLLRFDLSTLGQRQRQLELLADEEQAAGKRLAGYELRAQHLSDEVERQADLFKAVVKRLNEVSLVQSYGGYNTQLIDTIRFGKLVAPKASVTVMMGAALCLLLGAAAAVAAEFLDPRFHSPEQMCHQLGLPILAHVPVLAAPPTADGARSTESLVVLDQPRSAECESFRGLRTSLLMGDRTGRQVVSLTSPHAHAGKSMLLANLAVCLAQAGRRVLVVDGDLRQPRQDRLFGLPTAPGLAQVLAGEITAALAIRATNVKNLSVLSAGGPSAQPAELLAAGTLRPLCDQLRAEFDYVLVDSPPVLVVTDPCIIAQQCDQVLLAICPTLDDRAQISEAQRLLAEAGASVRGLVVNLWRGDRSARSLTKRWFYGEQGYEAPRFDDGSRGSARYFNASPAEAIVPWSAGGSHV